MSDGVLAALITGIATVVAAIATAIIAARAHARPGEGSPTKGVAPTAPAAPPTPPNKPITQRDPTPSDIGAQPFDYNGVVQAEDDDEAGGDVPSRGGRQELTMKVLHRCGKIAPGTEIVPMPEALPHGGPPADPDLFRVRLVNPPSLKVVWAKDGSTYSLTALSVKLWQEHGLQWIGNKTYRLWRIAGETQSMWDQAERLRGHDVNPGNE
jgi:hypothetical protein